jgi:hypothetical protein
VQNDSELSSDSNLGYRVIAVALVDLHLQRRLGVPGIDADDGQSQLASHYQTKTRVSSEDGGRLDGQRPCGGCGSIS